MSLLAPGTAPSDPQDQNPWSAAQILTHLEAVYAAAKTYEDTGVTQITVTLRDGQQRPTFEAATFKTAYRAADRFRFDASSYSPYTNSYSRWIIFRDGTRVRQWHDPERVVEREPSLTAALGKAWGLSGGEPYLIASLLMPGDVRGLRLSAELSQASRIDDAPCGQSQCFRVQTFSSNKVGSHEDSATFTLWIDSKTFVIRRMDNYQKPGGKVITNVMTTYEPVLDKPISEEHLDFNVPPG